MLTIDYAREETKKMIKQWLSAQYPDYNEKLLVSRDVMYITNKKNSKEQYIMPVARIKEIRIAYSIQELTASERIDMDIAPMEPILIIKTVDGATEMFSAVNVVLSYDYIGLEWIKSDR